MTNKSIYKIIIGIFFIGAGIYGYIAKQDEPFLQLVAIIIGAYGAWNIGWGVYLRKKEANEPNDPFAS